MSEKKKLLKLLQASLDADEKASSSNADALICDAKNEVHKLNLSYKEEMDKIYAGFIAKIDDDSEEYGWDDDIVENLKAEIQEMTAIHIPEDDDDDDDDEEEEEEEEVVEDDDEEDDAEEVALPVHPPAKKRGRPASGKGKGKGKSSPTKKAKKAPAKPASKKAGKGASSRPRGRTPANMQWSESEGKWVPMKAALKRVVGDAPPGTIWNEEKQEFVPLKAALKRLM
jgi:hypothetical protein